MAFPPEIRDEDKDLRIKKEPDTSRIRTYAPKGSRFIVCRFRGKQISRLCPLSYGDLYTAVETHTTNISLVLFLGHSRSQSANINILHKQASLSVKNVVLLASTERVHLSTSRNSSDM